MLDLKLVRSNPSYFFNNISKRGIQLDLPRFQHLDYRKSVLEKTIQRYREDRNKLSNFLEKKLRGKVKLTAGKINNEIKFYTEILSKHKAEFDDFYLNIPNITNESIPKGISEEDNVIVSRYGEIRVFDFKPQDHVDLGKKLKKIDFETAASLSSNGFVFLSDGVARMHRALSQFMLDLHTRSHMYTELYSPYIVNEQALYGTGQLPKFRDEQFKICQKKDLNLIATGEIPLVNYLRNKIIDEERLPIKFVSSTPCFRRESGSYGKDTRGMIRQHQFEKVELVQFVHPNQSNNALEEMTGHAEKVLQLLNLPYRKVLLCSGEMGFSASKTYDLEVWMPGQNSYKEISSCSNCGDFQARRIKCRFRDARKKVGFMHTLNGSGLAVGRTLVAIMENYQKQNGHIVVPEVLKPYMGGLDIIR